MSPEVGLEVGNGIQCLTAVYDWPTRVRTVSSRYLGARLSPMVFLASQHLFLFNAKTQSVTE